MKSLILKDLCNIIHNSTSMLFILLFFAVVFLPSSGIQGYIYTCAILCSMMIVTTLSFDERSASMSYALVMPVSRRDLAAGKYIVLFLFSSIGVLFGLIVGIIGSFIHKSVGLLPENLSEIPLPMAALTALAFSTVFGSISIPLTLKFGAEKGRILVFASFFIPVAICYIIYRLLAALGIAITGSSLAILLYCSPAAAIVWNYFMFQISCFILSKKEF